MQSRTYRHWLCGALAVVILTGTALPALAGKTVLRVRLDGPVMEAPNENMELMALLGGSKSRTLRQWTGMIDKAAKDSDIDAMVMIVEQPMMSLAQAEELIRSLQAFRAAGKKIHCYLDYGTNLSYLLATAADDITMPPYSALETVGLHAEQWYFKGMLDKIGVEADMMHCGDYKSALEPYTRTGPSDAAADNINWLLDGIYGRWTDLIATNRGHSKSAVQRAIDNAPLDSDAALEAKLVDRVASWGEFKKYVEKHYGKDVKVLKKYKEEDPFKLDFDNPFAFFNIFNELMEKTQEAKKPGLAVIYVEGGIVVGKSQNNAFDGTIAGSTSVRAALEDARGDDQVKAVVLRVDSPGGSAIASDLIWQAATRLAEEKPLIVSMGGVAGSGGYYVSIPGDRIFAEEMTITGSIGVVGGKLVLRDLFNDKLGITVAEYDRGARAGLMSSTRQWSDGERKYMRKMLDDIYDQFKGRVTQSRGDRIKGELEELAGGRVYTGRQALERGLVDEIGGLGDAMAYAANKAGLETDFKVYTLPKPKDLTDVLRELSGEPGRDEWEIGSANAHTPLRAAPKLPTRAPWLEAALPLLQKLSPEAAEAATTCFRNLLVIQEEHVGCFMPAVPSIR